MWRKRFRAILIVAFVIGLFGETAFANFTSGRSQPQDVSTAVLTAPTGLTAVNGLCVPNNFVRVNLSWTASASLATSGYTIMRMTGFSGIWSQVGTVNGRTTTTFVDTSAAFNTIYIYRVFATRNNWTSPYSNLAGLRTRRTDCT